METNTELKMIHLSEVESQQIKWLWYPFIPYEVVYKAIVRDNFGRVYKKAARVCGGKCSGSS